MGSTPIPLTKKDNSHAVRISKEHLPHIQHEHQGRKQDERVRFPHAPQHTPRSLTYCDTEEKCIRIPETNNPRQNPEDTE